MVPRRETGFPVGDEPSQRTYKENRFPLPCTGGILYGGLPRYTHGYPVRLGHVTFVVLCFAVLLLFFSFFYFSKDFFFFIPTSLLTENPGLFKLEPLGIPAHINTRLDRSGLKQRHRNFQEAHENYIYYKRRSTCCIRHDEGKKFRFISVFLFIKIKNLGVTGSSLI